MGGSKGSSATSRFSHYVKAPFRALGRMRDMYVNSMAGCARPGINPGGARGYPAARIISGVPRSRHSFSPARPSSSEEDIRELIRAASQGTLGSLNLNGVKLQEDVVPRSQSVAIGRIDEDSAYEFSGDPMMGMDLMYPRSRSCAVVSKNRIGVVA